MDVLKVDLNPGSTKMPTGLNKAMIS